MKLIALNEGYYSINNKKKFNYINKFFNNDTVNKNNIVTVQPFLIEIKGNVYLIDTGLGFINNNKNILLNNISKYGYKCNDISKILISHLHPDHFGGLFRKIHNEKYILNFCNSIHYIQKHEIENYILYYKDHLYSQLLIMLYNHKNTILLNDHNGKIDQFVNYEITGGHTQFHQIFWINYNNHKYIFGGDIIAIPKHINMYYKTNYDFNSYKSLKLRNNLTQKIYDNKYTCLLYHHNKYKIDLDFNPSNKKFIII